jgi:hypothetical protein
MAETESPRLRPVRPRDATEPHPAPPPGAGGEARRERRWLVALGLLLFVVAIALGWSRARLASRVEALEAEVSALGTALEARDRVIDAHQRRNALARTAVDDALGRLGEARALLEPKPAE